LLLAGCASQPAPPPRPPEPPRTVQVKAQVEAPPASSPVASPTESVALETPKPTVFKPRPVVVPRTLPGPERASQVKIGPPDDPSSAASWRERAERCVKLGAFSEASRSFAEEAKIYRRKGDPEAALVEDLKAARYRTEIQLFYWRPARELERPAARLEPARGCMVGAFIDRDDLLPSHSFGPQRHGDIPAFNKETQKRHASFFTYLSLQREFPQPWADYVREQGAIPNLAWEPRDLREVGPGVIRPFVEALKSYGGPVILRFASEMNGDWTRYHGDPALYRRTFRYVYEATREVPGAVMLWCPNAIPADSIEDYYPGDDACDWVGVNFYSVMFLDNDPKRPGDWIHPIDLLDGVYRRYAQRKPIAIGEYAASHQSSQSPTARLDFARIKLAQLYQALPLCYPGVKLVNWYDCNNLTQARSERQLNNFQLTDQPEIVQDYAQWVNHPWFLGARQRSSPVEAAPFPKFLPGPVEVEPWVRSYLPDPQVFFRLDGKLLALHQLPQGGRLKLPSLRDGKHKLEVLVYDRSGKFIEKKTYLFEV
jgi:hypothetical protein